jgi:hypothetical protein
MAMAWPSTTVIAAREKVTTKQVASITVLEKGNAIEAQELVNVQEHQNSVQLRTACDDRGNPSGLSPVRPKNQRLQQTLEGQRSCVSGGCGRDHRGRDSAYTFAWNDSTT